MKNRVFYKFRYGIFILVASLVQACSVSIPVDDPDVSKSAYSGGKNKIVALNVEDKLGSRQTASSGKIKVNLKHNGAPIKAGAFAIEHLKKELESRGLPIDYQDASTNKVEIQQFDVLSHRVSGFSPMVTISTMKVSLKTEAGEKIFVSMVKRAKVPVWSITELYEPCYNEPIELMIKEIAAKINMQLFGQSLTDAQIDALVTKIQKEAGTDETRLTYLDAYELGFSNNPRAIEPLKALIDHSNDYVRMAAISGLGTLGAEQYFSELERIYNNAKLWHDRGMALKAIGDFDNEKSSAFLKAERKRWQGQNSDEAIWNSAVIDLYLGSQE